MAIKIEVKKSYEDVEIASTTYRMDLSDEKLKEYSKAIEEFREEVEKLSEKDFLEMSQEEQDRATDKNYELMGNITDLLLGKGAYHKVYEDTGRSSLILADILTQLIDIVEKKMAVLKVDTHKYYVGK